MNDELRYALKLIKLKLMYFKRNLAVIGIIWIGLYIVEIITNICIMNSSKSVKFIEITDYLFGIVVVIAFTSLVRNISYDDRNKTQNVYPGNNVSKYVASVVINDGFCILCLTIVLLEHFVTEGILRIICICSDNAEIVYNFSLSYELIGYLEMLLIILVINNIVALCASLLRKFRVFAIVISMAIFVAIVNYIRYCKPEENILFKFYFDETNIALFLIKLLFTYIILVLCSIIVNKYIDVDNIYGNNNSRGYVLAQVATNVFILVIGIVLNGIAIDNNTEEYGRTSDYVDESTNIDIDISSVNIDNFKIVLENFDKSSNSDFRINGITDGNGENLSDYICTSADNYTAEYDGKVRKLLSAAKEKKLSIIYLKPYEMKNDIVISDYRNASVKASLEKDTLHLKYVEEPKAMLVHYTWPVMSRSDSIYGRRLAYNSFSNSSGSGSGGICIEVK